MTAKEINVKLEKIYGEIIDIGCWISDNESKIDKNARETFRIIGRMASNYDGEGIEEEIRLLDKQCELPDEYRIDGDLWKVPDPANLEGVKVLWAKGELEHLIDTIVQYSEEV